MTSAGIASLPPGILKGLEKKSRKLVIYLESLHSLRPFRRVPKAGPNHGNAERACNYWTTGIACDLEVGSATVCGQDKTVEENEAEMKF
jgi:hypothetical protein